MPEAYFFPSTGFSIFPEPLHFVQLLPAFAASTQQACVQVLPSLCALAQQPATFDSVAANMIVAENRDATAAAINDFETFFILCWGG